MKIETIYRLTCLNCRFTDTAQSEQEATEKAVFHLQVGSGLHGEERPGLGHSGHEVFIEKGEKVSL